MRLPFIQLESDLIAHGAGTVGTLARCPLPQAIGHITLLRAWAVSQGTDGAPPDGWVRGTSAARLVEAAAQWTGEPGALLGALSDARMVDVSAEGVRILGLEPYRTAWERNRKAKERMAHARTRSAPLRERSQNAASENCERDAKFMGQTQTQTQTQKETTTFPADAGRVGADGEEAQDAGPEPSTPAAEPVQAGLGLLTPVDAPKPPRAKRKPSPGVALYEAMEAAREGRWKAHVLAHPETYPEAVADPEDGWRRTFIAQQWAPARAEKELGPLAKRDDAGRQRLEAAFEEYLADDVGLSREPPWSLPWFLRCLPSYETRAMRAATGSAA